MVDTPNTSASPPQQISGTVRVAAGYLITNGLTYIAAKGLIPADQIGPIATWILEGLPFFLGAAHAAFSYWNNRRSAQVARVDSMQGAHVIVTDQATKDAVPSVTLPVPGATTVTVAVPR